MDFAKNIQNVKDEIQTLESRLADPGVFGRPEELRKMNEAYAEARATVGLFAPI